MYADGIYYTDETYGEQYFDENGVTCKSAEGAYGKKTTVDGKGRVTAVEYLDPNGKRMLNNQGYGLMTVSYHSFGEERVVAYYGSGKRLVVVPALGYAKVVNEYSYKTMTLREYQDTKGKPVDCAQGYASVKQKLDKKSLVANINIGEPNKNYVAKLGHEPRIQLNDQFAEVNDIAQFVMTEKMNRDEASRNRITWSLKVDKKVKMGIVTDVKQELRHSNAFKVNYSSTKSK